MLVVRLLCRKWKLYCFVLRARRGAGEMLESLVYGEFAMQWLDEGGAVPLVGRKGKWAGARRLLDTGVEIAVAHLDHADETDSGYERFAEVDVVDFA